MILNDFEETWTVYVQRLVLDFVLDFLLDFLLDFFSTKELGKPILFWILLSGFVSKNIFTPIKFYQPILKYICQIKSELVLRF
jgi:hypothetical protein